MKKKREHSSIHNGLRIVIGVLAIILAALLIRKGYTLYQDKLEKERLEVRHQEVQSQVDDIRMKIKELSGDGEALQAYLNEKINSSSTQNQEEQAQADQEIETEEEESSNQEILQEESQEDIEEASSDSVVIEIPDKAKPQPPEGQSSISGNQTDTIAEDTVSGNNRTETVSGQDGNTISGNAIVDGEVVPFHYVGPELTLEQKRNLKSSFAETMQINGADKAKIAGKTYDFSDMKIACLGDSITEGSNLNDMENYQQYAYPSVLKTVLNAEEVYNLGIGGSSIGRYWDKPFVERYKDIPQDTDIIIVMGGTNDGFAASTKELGSIEERNTRTFYGDTNELMKGLKKDYPNAAIVFATPLPNILHDYLRSERDYLLPQSDFADAINVLAAEYGIDVIDLYNSNILDTHDTQVISSYMPDGVHGNPAGYQILAEHFASQLVDIMERRALEGNTVSGNSSIDLGTISGNTTSGNSASGNSAGSNELTSEEKAIPSIEGKQSDIQKQPEVIESAEEKAERLKKEQENNKKVAQDAVVVTQPQETAKPPTENNVQAPEENKVLTPDANDKKNEYKYDGEAIIIH